MRRILILMTVIFSFSSCNADITKLEILFAQMLHVLTSTQPMADKQNRENKKIIFSECCASRTNQFNSKQNTRKTHHNHHIQQPRSKNN